MEALYSYKFQWQSAKAQVQEAVELLDKIIDCSNSQDIQDMRDDIESLRKEETRTFNEYTEARRAGVK